MVDFERARIMMVESQVKTSNVTDRRVWSAMLGMPRELFVPEDRRDLAYIDAPHKFTGSAGERFLAAPAPFAKLVQLGEVDHTDRVLDVGCTSGYSTAVLARLGAHVVGVESDAALAAAAQRNLSGLGITNAEVVRADLLAGAPDMGPYDVIIVEGAVDSAPESLFRQLKVGGRLVALIRRGATATAYHYTKSATDVAGTPGFNTSLPALQHRQTEPEFVF